MALAPKQAGNHRGARERWGRARSGFRYVFFGARSYVSRPSSLRNAFCSIDFYFFNQWKTGAVIMDFSVDEVSIQSYLDDEIRVVLQR